MAGLAGASTGRVNIAAGDGLERVKGAEFESDAGEDRSAVVQTSQRLKPAVDHRERRGREDDALGAGPQTAVEDELGLED